MSNFTDGNLEIAAGVLVRRHALRFAFSRASGPGGQAVNKLSTRAELRVLIADIEGLPPDAADRLRTIAGQRLTQADEIVLHAQDSRSQLDNKQACLDRLAVMIRSALVRPKRRRKTKPSRSKVEKRLESKRRIGATKKQRRNRPSGGDFD